MRTPLLLVATLLAPLALASQAPATDLVGSVVVFPWARPGDAVDLHVGVGDLDPDSAGVPAIDVVLKLNGVILDARRITAGATHVAYDVPWIATAGVHTLELVVDASHEVAEADESNNVNTRLFRVTHERPDLAVEDLSLVTDGDAMRVDGSALACNRGGVTTRLAQPGEESPVDFFALAVRPHGETGWRFLDALIVPVLAPGECVPYAFTWQKDVVVGSVEFQFTSLLGGDDADPSNDRQVARADFLGGELGARGVWLDAGIR